MKQQEDEGIPLYEPPAADEFDWKNNNSTNYGIFYDARTSTSFEEMRGSLLEGCCPGDSIGSGALGLVTCAATPTMLALPLAFATAGSPYAFLCMLFCIVITFLSVRILALASISASSEDYETVASFFFGFKGKVGTRCVLFFYNFGCSVVYLSFIKDSIQPPLKTKATFLPDWLRGENGGTVFLLLSMLVITPLAFNSRLASLRTKGLISNLITVLIIISIIYRYFYPAVPSADAQVAVASGKGHRTAVIALTSATTQEPGRPPAIRAPLSYMFVAPIFVFSYEVQSNVMAVIKDLRDRTGKRILKCIAISLTVVTLFYSTLGLFGSWTFPNLREGNILANYDVEHDDLMMVCQILCCFSAAISFVFCIFPCRQAAFMFFSDGKSTKIPKTMRMKLSTTLSLLAFGCAVFLPDVATVVSLLGAIFSSTLSMTLPSLFAMKMRSSGTYLGSYYDLFLNWALLLTGIGFSLIGTAMAVMFGSS